MTQTRHVDDLTLAINKTSDYTAVTEDLILADTDTVGAFTITLPINASRGDSIKIWDANGTFAVNNLTVSRNGHNIRGVAADLTLDVNWVSIELIYVNETIGWRY